MGNPTQETASNKLITFAIPCYNSANYMDVCIKSILNGSSAPDAAPNPALANEPESTHALGAAPTAPAPEPAAIAKDVQIVIVNDGSQKDNTAEKADEWAKLYPDTIKAVHQENGGHGAAVLKGLENAEGTFFKVVDSDDWVDAGSVRELLDRMRDTEAAHANVDLFIANYVYEHTADHTRNVVGYGRILPKNRVFRWDEIGHFLMSQNLLMHALCYRTSVLRDEGVPLPSHTFYVDNIYAWVPLPRCERLYYLDVDLYRYFIGREDQSVNEKVMASRIDQQRRITRIMMEQYHLYRDIPIAQLRSYMVNYFVLMMTICSIFSKLSEQPDAMSELKKLWNDLYKYDRRMWRRCRLGIMGLGSNLPTKLGEKTTIALYHLAGKVVKFN
ncbi:MAG: glycosyltransferase family 2 protein [Coriobacteriales bacterium]|nr:glycosyltransferase family 2 protein [Coriobacteriales bacterium]